nr:immunoglobulin light chain junction region [Macaca mulatta]MOV64324.1 immunoglobulin light chain junction region [Macaca mulatta]MOV65166.1 immunoglobulin light chain junction region [Macaca mulatta]
CLQSKTSPWTF